MLFNSYQFKRPSKLFGTQNAKTIKGEDLGYKTFILYMSPEKQNSMGKSICPKATNGCKSACLFTAGRGVFNRVKTGRLHKTEYFLRERDNFMYQMAIEIAEGIQRYGAENIAVRLNGTSDIPYENIPVGNFKNIMDMFFDVQFYDYTKIASRFDKPLPPNYHLTFSMAETIENKIDCFRLLDKGNNVAAVFNVKNENDLPKKYKGYKVINGDQHDLTFKHKQPKGKKGVIIGLKAKGMAKKDTSGFVITDF